MAALQWTGWLLDARASSVVQVPLSMVSNCATYQTTPVERSEPVKIRKLYELVVDDDDLAILLNVLYFARNSAQNGTGIAGLEASDIDRMSAMCDAINNIPKD